MIFVSTQEWQSVLIALEQSTRTIFPLSGEYSLHSHTLEAFPGRSSMPFHAAKFAAVLEHESLADQYGAVIENGQLVAIHLLRDF